MTTATPIRPIQLAPAGFPMLTRMLSDPLFPPTETKTVACPHCKQNLAVNVPVPSSKEKDEPIAWIVGQQHPLMPEMEILRMFIEDDGVMVYSVSKDKRAGSRNLVPMKSVRLTEEAMPLDVFAEELADAEGEDDPGEPGEPGEPGDPGDPDPVPAALPANGQPS